MYYTDDPVADFEKYDRDCEQWRSSLPECACCGEHIQQESAVKLDDEWFCDDCLNSARRFIDVDW